MARPNRGHLDLSLPRGPSPIAPSAPTPTWPLPPALSYYHNFPETLQGLHNLRGIRVLQNVLCFIAFKSLIGQRRGPTMIRKPVMWKMKDLEYRTERWRREIIKYMTNVEVDCISCSTPSHHLLATLKTYKGKERNKNQFSQIQCYKGTEASSPHLMIYISRIFIEVPPLSFPPPGSFNNMLAILGIPTCQRSCHFMSEPTCGKNKKGLHAKY